MLAGIVVVRRQPFPVLRHRLDRLGTVPKCLLELLSLCQRLFAALGVHHGLEMALDLALLFSAHRVDHVEHLPASTGSFRFKAYERVRHLFSFSTLFDFSSVEINPTAKKRTSYDVSRTSETKADIPQIRNGQEAD
jgi:hypothetical protein